MHFFIILSYNLPKPLARWVILSSLIEFARVFSLFLPVFQIDLWLTTYEQFELLTLKNCQQWFGNDVKDAQEQLVHLWLDAVN
jgi:hypothetical protein